MARFYGFQPSEISNMAIDELVAYLRAMTMVKATEKLDEVRVSSYPHMDKSGRERTHRQWHKEAMPMLHSQPKKKLSLADVAQVMGAKKHG